MPIFSKPVRVVHATSLDADNCVLNKYYRNLNDPLSVCKANDNLIHHLKRRLKRHKLARKVLLCGSLRQYDEIDKLNSNNPPPTNSYFLELERFHQHLRDQRNHKDLELDRFLLGDLRNGKQGYTFNKCLGRIDDQNEHPRVPSDDSKIALIYVHLHKLASENPGAEIIYDFYDDRHDILDGIHAFYSAHPELMPANVKLHLYHYLGDDVTHKHSLDGAGLVDQKYQEGFWDMVLGAAPPRLNASRENWFALTTYHMRKYLNVPNFKKKRSLDNAFGETEPEEESTAMIAKKLCISPQTMPDIKEEPKPIVLSPIVNQPLTITNSVTNNFRPN